MRSTIALLSAFAAACGTTTEVSDQTGLDPYWNGSDEAFVAYDGLRDSDLDVIDVTNPNKWKSDDLPGLPITMPPLPEWWRANVRTGIYETRLVQIQSNTCDFEIPANGTAEVFRALDSDELLLWGYAPILTNGEILRVAGSRISADPEVDCARIEVVDADGGLIDAASFALNTRRIVQFVGDDCDIAEGTSPSCATEYTSEFIWMDDGMPDDLDTGL